MLNPNERQLYLDALKPPVGYSLDRAIATTYSLDLLTLLVVPLSMVLFDYDGSDDLKDPTKVLEALRRTADKMTIYCQRGRIGIPKVSNLLYSYLEKTVAEVNQPPGGVFHPKTWLLRFTAPNQPAAYRFLCLSRNLTFDKSWDTILILEGGLNNKAVTENTPLLDYYRALPNLALSRTETPKDILNELAQVKFAPPPGFEKIRFFPLGIEGHRKNSVPNNADRLLVVSPFLSDKLLQDIVQVTDPSEAILLSRIDSLDALARETTSLFNRIYTLDDQEHEGNASEGENFHNHDTDLHAKLFILERGNNTHIFTGSANATNSAFSINTEFMTELTGSVKDVGIESFLASDRNPFGTVIKEYKCQEDVQDNDTEATQAEKLAENVRDSIANSKLEIQVTPDVPNTFSMNLTLDQPLEFKSDITGTCWPVTINSAQAQDVMPLLTDGKLNFTGLATETITGFVAFEITAKIGRTQSSSRFTLNVPVTGMPEDRYEKILISIISDRARFLRYLLFLLAEGQDLSSDTMELIHRMSSTSIPADATAKFPSIPLFEEMVKALSRNPQKIDNIARLVNELQKTEDGREILPEGFEQIWTPIWEARQRMVKRNGKA